MDMKQFAEVLRLVKDKYSDDKKKKLLERYKRLKDGLNKRDVQESDESTSGS